MLYILNKLLDLIAPAGKGELLVEDEVSSDTFEGFISSVSRNFKFINSIDGVYKFRVKGDFFSDFEARKIVKGNDANPNHYINNGFNLEVSHIEKGFISLKGEERIILGYLETKAFGEAIKINLENIVSCNLHNA
ncbi:hypothetical protein [Psychromonas aquimarina]|uniref:hypothetical protein n=1 Tax=Psychromonas aquimarina TaxID=444919 RepID=UPI00048F6A40|nr:hypothetical protein [Psychromonas aquimarina]